MILTDSEKRIFLFSNTDSTNANVRNLSPASIVLTFKLSVLQAVSMLNGQILVGKPLHASIDHGPHTEVFLPVGLKSLGPGFSAERKPLKDIAKQLQRYHQGKPSLLSKTLFGVEDDDSEEENVPETDERTSENAEDTVTTAEDTVTTAKETVTTAKKTVTIPVKTVSTAEKTVTTPVKTISTAEKTVTTPVKPVSIAKKTFTTAENASTNAENTVTTAGSVPASKVMKDRQNQTDDDGNRRIIQVVNEIKQKGVAVYEIIKSLKALAPRDQDGVKKQREWAPKFRDSTERRRISPSKEKRFSSDTKTFPSRPSARSVSPKRSQSRFGPRSVGRHYARINI